MPEGGGGEAEMGPIIIPRVKELHFFFTAKRGTVGFSMIIFTSAYFVLGLGACKRWSGWVNECLRSHVTSVSGGDG